MGGIPPGGGPAEGGPGIIRVGIGWLGPIGPVVEKAFRYFVEHGGEDSVMSDT